MNEKDGESKAERLAKGNEVKRNESVSALWEENGKAVTWVGRLDM